MGLVQCQLGRPEKGYRNEIVPARLSSARTPVHHCEDLVRAVEVSINKNRLSGSRSWRCSMLAKEMQRPRRQPPLLKVFCHGGSDTTGKVRSECVMAAD